MKKVKGGTKLQVKQSPNILNWYQFKKEDLILVIGNEVQEIVKMLQEKCKKITVISTDKKIKQNEKVEVVNKKLEDFNRDFLYDYIILIGINEKAKELTKGNLKLVRNNAKIRKKHKARRKVFNSSR